MNLCRDEIRRRSRSREQLEPAPDEPSSEGADGEAAVAPAVEGPDQVILHEEEARSVRAALARLPVAYREVLVLRHYEGLKFREIAEVLSVPEGTVKSRMAEGLSRMAVLLGSIEAR